MASTIIESLRDYMLDCPLMFNGRLNVDFLPENTQKSGVEYSIDTTPAEEVLKLYMRGAALCQYVFTIRSVEDYESGHLQNMSNSGFFEKLSSWLTKQTKAKNLPDLPDGLEPREIKAQSTGYLFTVSADSGKYQIQCRLLYFRRGD